MMKDEFNPSQELLNNIEEATDRFIEDLEDILRKNGYSVRGAYTGDSIDIVVSGNDPETMPSIYLTFAVDSDDDDAWMAIPELSFPMLKYDPDSDYPDTIHYWIDKWGQVGSAITAINKYRFYAEDYVAEL